MAHRPRQFAARNADNRCDDALQRAMLALNSGRPREAEAIVGAVLKADPRHLRALHIFGTAQLMLGHTEEAVAALEQAARGRHDAEIDTILAIALRQAGRSDEAYARLKQAIKRRPPYAVAYHELGCLLFSLGRYDEAIATFRDGLAVAPMMPELSIQLGNVFLRCRNCAEARTAFARALDISPHSPEALFGMAKSHQEVGENQEAAEYFRRYLMGRPDDSAAWLNLGHCLLELGDRETGYGCFRTAARGDAKRFGTALTSLAASARGRFWLKQSAAERFLRR
ncbi:MAG TPA: tetratricopeptide repeat protein [Xanthobacteraceae bacterium]